MEMEELVRLGGNLVATEVRDKEVDDYRHVLGTQMPVL
mgnify:CR=1 FL=1